MADGLVRFGDGCAEQDVPLHVMVSWMHRSGALILEPGSADPRCWLVSGFESHAEDCFCRFVPVHPDIEPVSD
jgi:hypothetical protein